MSERKRKNGVLKGVLALLGYIVAVFVIVLVMNTFVIQRTIVSGVSMYPTLDDGQNLIVNKLSYRFNEPKRFDVVILKDAHKDRLLIKRVIGLPGESIQLAYDVIYINGEPLNENYGYEPNENLGRAVELVVLGEDEYFVIGDNRNDSEDSRSPAIGNIHKSQIVGKAIVRVWPLQDIGFLKHWW